MYQNNNNNIIIIIIIIIIIKCEKNHPKGAGFIFAGGSVLGGKKILFIFCFFLRSMKIGLHVFVGTEGKVDLRDESYEWTPKSWSFVKLHEVGNFPTCIISSLKGI